MFYKFFKNNFKINLLKIISMLYVLSCASRLLIYLSCNEEIRIAFYDFLCTNCICNRERSEIEYDFDEKNDSFLQRNGSTQYTPIRQCSYRFLLFLNKINKFFFF
jgi:hypothetical protein